MDFENIYLLAIMAIPSKKDNKQWQSEALKVYITLPT